MYILFEEHKYEPERVKDVLKGIFDLQDVDKKISVNYVGYFYNPQVKDCVFILPKILLEDASKMVDGKSQKIEAIANIYDEQGQKRIVEPEDIITPKGQEDLPKQYRKFIYEFAVWIYRAIVVFYKDPSNKNRDTVYYKHVPQTGHGKRHQSETFLDIILSLIRFNNENRDFITFTVKNLNRGHNKICWTKTVSHSQAILQSDTPVYLDLVNKKRVINDEEELLIIFFSILNYLNEEYGFRTITDIRYELIKGTQFRTYLEHFGKLRLKQIKYKYFTDKSLQLWDLCYAFFDNAHKIMVNMDNQDYLLVKNFNLVFEAIIDQLIGTPHSQIPKGLADQEDGKRVDHLYTDMALTSVNEQTNREVYYIGDSKYYKNGHSLTAESIYKQYTYARNVIQWNINLFLDESTAYDKQDYRDRKEDQDQYGNIHLQDADMTEGYDIIPNFFISAFINEKREYDIKTGNIRKHTQDDEHCTHLSYQFKDRLFDRDTMFLSQYDVNFLYVLYLYARKKTGEQLPWRQRVRRIFRDEIREVIEKRFTIYAMRARVGVDGAEYIRQHFYELNGRVFQPYGDNLSVYYAYAHPKEADVTTESLKNSLEQYFLMEPCKMGTDPTRALHTKEAEEQQTPIPAHQWLTMHYLEKYQGQNISVLIGYYKNDDHLRWILGKNDKGSLIYNVRLARQGQDNRDGSHTEGYYKKQHVQFVVLYTDGANQTGAYRVFHVKDTAIVKEERMKKTWYPSNNEDGAPMGDYFCYRFDEEISLGHLNLSGMIQFAQQILLANHESLVDKQPLFIKAEDILSHGFRTGL